MTPSANQLPTSRRWGAPAPRIAALPPQRKVIDPMSFTEKLPCTLDGYEIRERALRMAHAVKEHGQLELEKKLAAEGHKKKIDALDVEIAELAKVVRTGVEDRD